LYLAGDDAAALARFREYRDRLVHEIDAPPSAAMLELVRGIERAAQRPALRAATDFSAAAPSFEASLIGRESQWRTLMEVWDAVTRDAGRVVVIEGEAGVGKTRLAEDFSRWALTAGATVLRGAATTRRPASRTAPSSRRCGARCRHLAWRARRPSGSPRSRGSSRSCGSAFPRFPSPPRPWTWIAAGACSRGSRSSSSRSQPNARRSCSSTTCNGATPRA